jgi:hypothetical protein
VNEAQVILFPTKSLIINVGEKTGIATASNTIRVLKDKADVFS